LPFLVTFKSDTVSQQISIYQYIAFNAPYEAKVLCNKYGFSPEQTQTADDVASCLEDYVGNTQSETVFREILSLHPDKDVILQTLGSVAASLPVQDRGCGCKKEAKAIDSYLHATQGQQASQFSLHQGNILLIGSVLMLTVAIVVSKN
jgi:hypothetical protein